MREVRGDGLADEETLEHEPALRDALLSSCANGIMQILCRLPEVDRRAHLAARRAYFGRHDGHHDTDPTLMEDRTSDAFLDLPGARWVCTGDASLMPDFFSAPFAA